MCRSFTVIMTHSFPGVPVSITPKPVCTSRWEASLWRPKSNDDSLDMFSGIGLIGPESIPAPMNSARFLMSARPLNRSSRESPMASLRATSYSFCRVADQLCFHATPELECVRLCLLLPTA